MVVFYVLSFFKINVFKVKNKFITMAQMNVYFIGANDTHGLNVVFYVLQCGRVEPFSHITTLLSSYQDI
jgi:hypothetical protein